MCVSEATIELMADLSSLAATSYGALMSEPADSADVVELAEFSAAVQAGDLLLDEPVAA